MEKSCLQLAYEVPFDKLPFGSQVAIFGCGKIGAKFVRNIFETKRVSITAMIDSYATFEEFKGIPVYRPEMIRNITVNFFLIASGSNKIAKEMISALIEQGANPSQIIWGGEDEDDEICTVEYIKCINRFIQGYNYRFFLFMLPEHGNTGDYAIGYGEKKFLGEFFKGHQIIGVTTTEWCKARRQFMNLIRPDDVIMINGGGFFGDLRGDDKIYKDIVESFPQQKKIFFPNTLTYHGYTDENNPSFISDMEWLNRQSNLMIMLRDKSSYNKLSLYESRSYYFPDMAFNLWFHRNDCHIQNKVLLCFRDDCEKVFFNENELKEYLVQAGIKYDEFDIFTKEYVTQEDGYELLENIVRRFQSYDCIITDRLHGMIIAVISNVPCLAFDNYTHKISGVYEWISDRINVLMMKNDDVSDILDKIKYLVDSKQKEADFEPPYEQYYKMAQVIDRFIMNR